MCNEANGKAFPEGECYVCGGKALEADRMAGEGAAMLKAEKGAASFSISTAIPKEWMVREERAWDLHLGRSVKDFLNRRISAAVEKETGLPYGSEGDCRLVFDFSSGKAALERNDLFIFGRYRKFVPGLSQSRWLCGACGGKGCGACGGKGRNYESVEERVGEPLKKAAEADEYVMHASGREDVDATNSAGRPFVLMLKNPKNRRPALDAAAKEVSASGEVGVEGLRMVGRQFVEVVTESHFDKAYVAAAEFGRELAREDLESLRGLEGRTIAQQTPARVVHRRADITRHRKVRGVEVLSAEGCTAVFRITAEAGTYIKELISGDGGRTEPSMAGVLKTRAECKKLSVERIDDGFLDLCLRS